MPFVRIDERAEIAQVAGRWKRQYFQNGAWVATHAGNSKDVYDRLSALGPDATAEDVAAIIGNASWIGHVCTECYGPAKVRVGEEPDYDSSTVWLCSTCIRQLATLV